MEKERIYYARHPETGEQIMLREGIRGFFTPAWALRDDEVAANHREQGITSEMADAALACSMFGWDIPMARVARGELTKLELFNERIDEPQQVEMDFDA